MPKQRCFGTEATALLEEHSPLDSVHGGDVSTLLPSVRLSCVASKGYTKGMPDPMRFGADATADLEGTNQRTASSSASGLEGDTYG
jgi:hypothetical protein